MTRRVLDSRLFIAICLLVALGLMLSAGSSGMVASIPDALQIYDTSSPAAGTPAGQGTPSVAGTPAAAGTALAGETQAAFEDLVLPALDLPDSIDVTYLAAATPVPIPYGSVTLSLERVTVLPGEIASIGGPNDVSINVVETGTVLVEKDGTSRLFAAGGNFFLDLEERALVSTEGSTASTIVRLSISSQKTVAGTPVGTPVGVTAQTLARGEASHEASGDDLLYLVRLDLAPGADSGMQTLSGPAAVAAEQGRASVAVAGEATVDLDQGAGAILPAFTPVQVQSDSGASLLVGGVLSVDAPQAAGPTRTPLATPTTGPDLAATAQATADALSSQLMTAEADLAAAEASAMETASAFETVRAGLDADIASAQGTAIAQSNEIEALQTDLADAEATVSAVAAELQAVQTAAAESAATASAELGLVQANLATLSTREAEAAGTAIALETANAGLETDLAASEGTAVAQAEAIAALESSVQESEETLANAEATVEAQATAQASLESDLANAEATAQSAAAAASETIAGQATAIAAAQETASSLESTNTALEANVVAAEETAAAQAATSEAELAALQTAVADSAASAQAEGSAAAATISAQANAQVELQATAAADASAAAATAAELDAALAAERAAQETAEASLTSSQGTVAALSEEATTAAGLAVASLDPEFETVPVTVDSAGLLAGNPAAIEAAQASLTTALQPYIQAGCRAGVVLTFGRAPTIDQGVALATVVNAQLPEVAPDLFEGTAFDNFGDISPPYTQVDLRIYFFTGCAPAEER